MKKQQPLIMGFNKEGFEESGKLLIGLLKVFGIIFLVILILLAIAL